MLILFIFYTYLNNFKIYQLSFVIFDKVVQIKTKSLGEVLLSDEVKTKKLVRWGRRGRRT